MRIIVAMMILIMVTSILTGCVADQTCEKIVKIDNDAGEWDDAILYVAKRGAAASGHYEIVALVKIIEGAKTFCAGWECTLGGDIDSCVNFALDDPEISSTEAMLIGIAWDEFNKGDEIKSSDLNEALEIEWGEWTSNNYAMF